MSKTGFAAAAAAGVFVALAISGTAAQAAAPPPKTTHGACGYTETPDDPAARPVPLPPDPRHTPSHGKVEVVLRTNLGSIPLTLDKGRPVERMPIETRHRVPTDPAH